MHGTVLVYGGYYLGVFVSMALAHSIESAFRLVRSRKKGEDTITLLLKTHYVSD